MARLVKHTSQSPTQVKTDGTPVYVCRCGLTRNENGLCDGSHKITKDELEGTTYLYDEQQERKKAKDGCENCDCC